MAHDKRKLDPNEIELWAEHAERGRWTFDEARAFVLAFYAANPPHYPSDWVTPGDITKGLKSERSKPKPVVALALDKPVASAGHRAACMRQMRDVLGTAEWTEVRA
jgi:hypothetical protein